MTDEAEPERESISHHDVVLQRLKDMREHLRAGWLGQRELWVEALDAVIRADAQRIPTSEIAQAGGRLLCPSCGALLWHYPDGRETCSRCEYDQRPTAQQGQIDPHPYAPDDQSQGDCLVCGNGPASRDASFHKLLAAPAQNGQPPLWRKRVRDETLAIAREWNEDFLTDEALVVLAEAIADGLPSPTPDNGFASPQQGQPTEAEVREECASLIERAADNWVRETKLDALAAKRLMNLAVQLRIPMHGHF